MILDVASYYAPVYRYIQAHLTFYFYIKVQDALSNALCLGAAITIAFCAHHCLNHLNPREAGKALTKVSYVVLLFSWCHVWPWLYSTAGDSG